MDSEPITAMPTEPIQAKPNWRVENLKKAWAAQAKGQVNQFSPILPPDRPNLSPEAFAEQTARQIEEIIALLTKKLKKGTGKLPIGQTAVGLGILIDKLAQLRGQKVPNSVHMTQITVNGMTREEALAKLLPRQPKPRLAQSAPQPLREGTTPDPAVVMSLPTPPVTTDSSHSNTPTSSNNPPDRPR